MPSRSLSSAFDPVTAAARRGPVFRLAAYFALLFGLLIAGQFAISFMPRHPLGWATWIVVVLAALVAGWVVLAHMDGRAPAALGFTLDGAAARESVQGLLIGGAMIALAVAMLVLSGSAVFHPDSGGVADYTLALVAGLAYFGIAAAAEELLFRGYAFQLLVEWIGAWPAVIISSAVFSWMHGANPGIGAFAFANIFLAGVMLAVAYLRTRSLWYATAVHAGWNWTMATLFDFPVSGLTGFDTPMYDALARGPGWWTGGGFGPEAGLAGTIALLAGTLWLLRTRRVSPNPRVVAAGPLVEPRAREFERWTYQSPTQNG